MKTRSLKEITKRISTLFLSILMLLTMMPLTSFAANYSTNYSAYAAPTRTLIYQSPNMYGNDVRWFQCAINYLIVYGDNTNSKLSATKLDADGYYGNASKTACIAFQRKYGLSQDGMFGPASRDKMNAVLQKSVTNYSTNYSAYSAPTRTLIYQTPNMSGNDVRWFQCAINYLIINGDNNSNKLSTSKLNVDGYYGNASKTACIAFQKKYGLSQDGMFGPASVSKMKQVLAKKTTTTTTKKTTTTTKKKTTTTTKKKTTTTTKKKTTTTKKKTTTTKKKTTTTKKKTTTTAKKTTAKTTTTNYSTNYNSYSAPTRTLIYQTPNMSGSDVKWFQSAINYLIIKGDKNGSKLSTSKLNVDGYYGNASKTACIAFQKKYGLTQDGKFGSASLSKMKEMLKKPTTATKKTTTTTKKKTTTTTKKKTTTTKKKTTTTKKKTTTTKKKTTTTKKSTTTTKKATTTTYDTNFKSYTVPTRNLSYNSSSIMTGNDVKWFQSAINYLIIKGDKDGNKLSTSKLTVNGSYNSASKTACIAFQKKYGLDADGIFGPASLSKMKLLLNITPVSSEVTYFNSNDTTQLTKHFKVSEFRCKCGGSHQTKLNVALVYKLEELMGVIGADKAIVSSGYRCSKHDINVGGSGSGQHTYGNAVDICFYDKNGKVISTKIVSCRAQDLGFTGIANINKNYTYIHLDVRTSGKYYGNEIYGYNTVTNDFYAYYGISR